MQEWLGVFALMIEKYEYVISLVLNDLLDPQAKLAQQNFFMS